MIDFNTEPDEGKWYQVVEGTDEGGAFKLRPLSIDEQEMIDRVTVKKKDKVQRNVHFEKVTTNDILANKMRMRYIIMDWKNVAFKGKKVECTKENKDIIIKLNDFIQWIYPILEEMNETNAAVEEATLKNSEKPSDSTK